MKKIFFVLFLLTISTQAFSQYPCCVAFNNNGADLNYTLAVEQESCLARAIVEPHHENFNLDFKVYTSGSYSFDENIYSSYDEYLAGLYSNITTLYYFLFAKTNSSGAYTDMIVELKLPNTGFFESFDESYIGLIERKLNSLFEGAISIEDYELAELQAVKDLKKEFTKMQCCINPLIECNLCDFSERAFELDELNFITVLESDQFEILDENSNGTIYSQINYKEQKIETLLAGALSTLPDFRIMVTEDSDICSSNDFNLAKAEFYKDPGDFDVWFHVLTIKDDVKHLLMKFDRYAIMPFEEGDFPVLKNESNENMRGDCEDVIINFDNSSSSSSFFEMPPVIPNFDVDSDEQSLQYISELFNEPIEELRLWNPTLSNYSDSEYLPIETKVILYLDEYGIEIASQNEEMNQLSYQLCSSLGYDSYDWGEVYEQQFYLGPISRQYGKDVSKQLSRLVVAPETVIPKNTTNPPAESYKFPKNKEQSFLDTRDPENGMKVGKLLLWL